MSKKSLRRVMRYFVCVCVGFVAYGDSPLRWAHTKWYSEARKSLRLPASLHSLTATLPLNKVIMIKYFFHLINLQLYISFYSVSICLYYLCLMRLLWLFCENNKKTRFLSLYFCLLLRWNGISVIFGSLFGNKFIKQIFRFDS